MRCACFDAIRGSPVWPCSRSRWASARIQRSSACWMRAAQMLPVKNPEQLVFLERGDVPPGPQRSLSYAFFEQARAQHETLAGVCTFVTNPRVNVVLDAQAEVAKAQQVTGSFFAVLGVNALLGRTITEEDDKVPGAHPVVVISYRYWQRRFASDPAIVGQIIVLNGHPYFHAIHIDGDIFIWREKP